MAAQRDVVKEVPRAAIVDGLLEAQLVAEVMLQAHHVGADGGQLLDQLTEKREVPFVMLRNHVQPRR